MPVQTEFAKSVRERLNTAQHRASERLEGANADARKHIDKLVEKGRESQRDLSGKLRKGADDWTRRVKQARGKAATYVDSTSRDSAAAVAENLRRVASRLDRIAKRAAGAPNGVH